MQSERSGSRYPFTPSQWQELEHQALIYKYMVSGIPIPSDLLLPIRRSFLLESTRISPSLAFPPHTPLGWNCFPMGFGRKAEDPEPGRCRRTDGKKWRCSKEAYPDSKYCERHMHRGKNRSRKPVEISLATNTYTSPSSSTHYPLPASHSISSPDTNPLVYPYSTTSRPTNHHSLDSAAYSVGNYRYGEGMKHLERNVIFSGANGAAEREHPSQVKPRGALSFMAEENQKSYSLSKEEEEERKRPLRHFFD